MRILDLFSGIGGFSLGLERAGMQTVAFCEIDPFCRKVLAKHWPDVPCYEDVRELTAARLAADGIAVDVICGGVPCQDISVAGKGAGLAGERSGLWREYARIIGEIRPRFVIVENVAALLGRGLADVLGDLAALGLDAEWHCIPASAVGAPHRRDRLWIVAHAASMHGNGGNIYGSGDAQGSIRRTLARQSGDDCAAPYAANTNGPRLEGQWTLTSGIGTQLDNAGDAGWWRTEPDVGRVAHGVPQRVDRLKSLGNAVVPQVVQTIGQAILQAEAGRA